MTYFGVNLVRIMIVIWVLIIIAMRAQYLLNITEGSTHPFGQENPLKLTYYNYLEEVGGLFLPGKRNYKSSFGSSSRKMFLFRVQTERKVPLRNVSRSETPNIFFVKESSNKLNCLLAL